MPLANLQQLAKASLQQVAKLPLRQLVQAHNLRSQAIRTEPKVSQLQLPKDNHLHLIKDSHRPKELLKEASQDTGYNTKLEVKDNSLVKNRPNLVMPRNPEMLKNLEMLRNPGILRNLTP
jgi:hypothetical protein